MPEDWDEIKRAAKSATDDLVKMFTRERLEIQDEIRILGHELQEDLTRLHEDYIGSMSYLARMLEKGEYDDQPATPDEIIARWKAEMAYEADIEERRRDDIAGARAEDAFWRSSIKHEPYSLDSFYYIHPWDERPSYEYLTRQAESWQEILKANGITGEDIEKQNDMRRQVEEERWQEVLEAKGITPDNVKREIDLEPER